KLPRGVGPGHAVAVAGRPRQVHPRPEDVHLDSRRAGARGPRRLPAPGGPQIPVHPPQPWRNQMTNRRDLMKLAAVGGGVVFLSGLAGCATGASSTRADDFYFVQLSDPHWGFSGPPNPDAANTLRKAVA